MQDKKTPTERVKETMDTLKKNGFSVMSVADHVGISHVRLRNAMTGKSSRFDSKEAESIESYGLLALQLKGL